MKNSHLFWEYSKPLLAVFFAAFFGLLLHKVLFHFFVSKEIENQFIYSILFLYVLFTVLSVVIVAILIKIKQKNLDIVGYGFMIATSVKMVIAYLFLKAILNNTLPKSKTEKINFFMIFIYFLAIETIVTIRILNNKPQNTRK